MARCGWRHARCAMVPGVTLRLVQPDMPQHEKYRPPLCAAQLAAAAGSQRHRPGKPTHIIWPEARRRLSCSTARPCALDEIALADRAAAAP